jgi:transcriptional regulator with XRE-family HTH domain
MDEELKKYLGALGAKIKARRTELNLNMKDIMIASGYYDAQWRKYEHGSGGLELATLLKIAIVLKTTPSALLEGIPPPKWPEMMPMLRTPQEYTRGPRPSKSAGDEAKQVKLKR